MKQFKELSVQQQVALILHQVALLDKISNERWKKDKKGFKPFENQKR